MFKDVSVSYEPYYAEHDDITFVMKLLNRIDNGKLSEVLSMEVVGFYFGKPDARQTKSHIGKRKAIFDDV